MGEAPHPVQPFLRAAEHAAAELVVVRADGTLLVVPLTMEVLANHAAEAALILCRHVQRAKASEARHDAG